MLCTFAIGLCAAVDECDTVLDELLGAFDGGLGEIVVHGGYDEGGVERE